ncbi:MAG TPA: ATP-binding protein [Longimicrobium sp.]|nr:ATP-binding protein [Longimicrobium sp.]
MIVATRPTFGQSFLNHHAGSIISDLNHAVVEIVANSWDAGAEVVQITWPSDSDDEVAFVDDGTGMTEEEFYERWNTLNYNRLEHQGAFAEFPSGKQKRARIAFGKNGIGRHAMFFFADSYYVITAKNNRYTHFLVSRASGDAPFDIAVVDRGETDHHGTRLSAVVERDLFSEDSLVDLIGSRFVADPEFRIFVNGRSVDLTDLEHLSEAGTVEVPNVGTLIIRRFDSQAAGRTSKQSGVAWWVTRRLVGMPTWEVFDGPLLDARTQTGKRFVYVVEADALKSSVKPDWSGFYTTPATLAARRAISEYVRNDLRDVMRDIRRERKLDALRANRDRLQELPQVAQEHVARFTEEILTRSPTITSRDLDNAVEVLANLEQSRAGYELLEKLASLAPTELDKLDEILEEWTVQDAKRVLDELRYRLDLISELESLVENHNTDELHDLQPLFERGLWIFGPAFESLSFTSNRTLSTVVREFFGSAVLEHPRNRPDFVALPDTSIGLYSRDSFDENNEVSGIEEIVIVELKRGGFTLTYKEKDQAISYARELRRSGKVGDRTKIVAHVLGSAIEPDSAQDLNEGNTRIIPRRYSDVLRQAHARTFHLIKALEGKNKVAVSDRELDEVINPAQQEMIFPSDTPGKR